MKKNLLTLGLILSISSTVYAGNVNVQLNGKNVDFMDENGNKVEAQIVNNRTMVPMRKLFELLGAEVEWDGNTRIVTATKDDTKIKLQIDNENAEISKAGKTQNIKLDSKPIIIENRTMVPLRFISESLNKQVAWDSSNSTAIIIDYDYFSNKIKDKSNLLHEFINNKSTLTEVQLIRNYNDLKNPAFNTTSTVNVKATKTSNDSVDLIIDFVGNSELFKDIAKEGWSTISLNVKYNDDGITYTTSNVTLKKMLDGSLTSYKSMNLSGTHKLSFGDAIREYVNLEENAITSKIFSNLENEFNKFLSLFTVSNSQNISNIKLSALNYQNANNIYFDYTKFDDVIFDNEFVKLYSIINRLIFNYDITMDELLYDTSNISGNMSIQKGEKEMILKTTIDIINEYDEKVTYNISIKEN